MALWGYPWLIETSNDFLSLPLKSDKGYTPQPASLGPPRSCAGYRPHGFPLVLPEGSGNLVINGTMNRLVAF